MQREMVRIVKNETAFSLPFVTFRNDTRIYQLEPAFMNKN